MSTNATAAMAQAHAVVAALGDGRWRLDKADVVDRLHELVADPAMIRQGRLNLCGPAALMSVWLKRDPVAVATYAVELFEAGRSRIGPIQVRPSRRLVRAPFGRTDRERSCPAADWMLMAALRDSSNRVLPYSGRGVAEPAAAITTPRMLRRWLTATGRYGALRDETNLVLRRPLGHASGLATRPDRDIFLLVAMEMFGTPASAMRRGRDRVVSLLPNHWVIARAPLDVGEPERIGLRFWSWGAEYRAQLPRSVFARCYYGALVADVQV